MRKAFWRGHGSSCTTSRTTAFCEPGALLSRLTRLGETPVLIVQGSRDRVCPPRAAQELAGRLPGAELRLVEGGGHSATAAGDGAALRARDRRAARPAAGREDAMSLRLRINLVITLLTVAFTAAMVYVIVTDLRSSVREEIESTTRVAVQLVETVVAGVYLEPGPTTQRTETLLALLKRVGRVRGNDIRFYDEGGALLYQSPPSTYRAGKRAPEWFSALVRPEVAEARLNLPGGSIVVTPDASRSIVEAWDDLQSLALLALAFLVLVNAAVFWLLDRALKPLPQILDGLRRADAQPLQHAAAGVQAGRVRRHQPGLQPHGAGARGKPGAQLAARAGRAAVERRHHHPGSRWADHLLQRRGGAAARLRAARARRQPGEPDRAGGAA